MKVFALGFATLTVLLGLGLVLTYVITAPEPPDPESSSARWLAPGPHAVGERDFAFVDNSRPTKPNNEYPGASSRTLNTTIWFPEGVAGDHPLIIYSHGFMSTRTGGKYLARGLASHGYVVASADYPLTNFAAPGGPDVSDVDQQPGDVTFLISSILALNDEKPFAGQIDPQRIGAMGLSLGGLTTTLATFHPRMRDPRIGAAVSIAGPASMFTTRFFDTTATPLLMIAGTADAIVDYAANAAIIPDRAAHAALLSIEGGSHTAFASLAEPWMRLFDNPDSLGCYALTENLGQASGENPFAGLGGADEGVVFDGDAPPPCSVLPLSESIHPGRQHMMTLVAVRSFFESVFAEGAEDRDVARTQLTQHISADFPEASFAM